MTGVAKPHATTLLAEAVAGYRRIGFLTLPNYSMIALANALDACRIANYSSGREVYSWKAVTLEGVPAVASNGLSLNPTVPLGEAGELDLLMVCGGVNVRHAAGRGTLAALRRADRKGLALGALCTGAFALAEAGLLDGYRCAIHWENLAAIREEFPNVAFQEDLFVIDRNRLTCTGGVAPLDMMLALISASLGPRAAGKVAEQFIARRLVPIERQTVAPSPELAARCPPLARATEVMARHLERPIPVGDIAAAANLSQRQLERLFHRHLATSPAAYYLDLRFSRARELLRLSPMRITDVALVCGFQSGAHFSAGYSKHFGHPPREERPSPPSAKTGERL
jgi:transcriptional regulator GlxA family with amidase domain